MTQYLETIPALAKRLGVAQETVRYWCRKLGIPRHGRDYLIDDSQAREIESGLRPGRGRPRHATRASTV